MNDFEDSGKIDGMDQTEELDYKMEILCNGQNGDDMDIYITKIICVCVCPPS